MLFSIPKLVCLLVLIATASALQLEYNQYNNAVGPLFSDSPVDNTVVSGFTVTITANRNSVDYLYVQNSFSGYSSFNPNNGILTVTFYNDIQITTAVNVLKNVYFRTTADDDRTRTITYQWAYPFNNNRAFLFSGNGHYYEMNYDFYGPFSSALTFCSSRTILGRKGYVYTPNTAAEHNYVIYTVNGQGWAAATDANHEGTWTYNAGPEFGQTITFSQWAWGEPNNYRSDSWPYTYEEQLQIYGGGNWNDLWGTSYLGGLVCEYGGLSTDTPTATPVYTYALTTVRYVGSPNPSFMGIAASCSVSTSVLNSLSYTKYYCPSYSCGATNVVGSNPYLYSSTLCQAAQHAGIPQGQSFYIVHLSNRETILPASNQNGIQSGSTSSAQAYSQYRIESADTPNPIPSTPYAPYLQCHSINFFVEEGKPLTGNLQVPSNINNNFNDILYAELPNAQPAAAANCYGGNLVFELISGPSKHTDTTGTAYTPAYGPFTLNADGTFTYIHLPTKADPTVWNGDDGFTFRVRCTGTNEVCPSLRAKINVVPTSAASQNAPPVPFTDGYSNGVKCTGTCANKANGMWLARQTLPRLWDMQRDETGAYVKNSLVFGGETKATDALDFEWTSNAALISTYSAISNMAVRFPTFEVVEWQVDQTFTTLDLNPSVALMSTGFDQNCLQYQGFGGEGTDVWVFNTNQQDGSLGPKYGSGKSWYQKFGGKHSSCDIFTGVETTLTEGAVRKSCRYAPLYSPRPSQDENQAGVWRVDINGCSARWQGKFTWNAMKAQALRNGNMAWNIAQGTNGGDYTITANIYSQVVQPNSWTQPSRGFVETDTKYLLTVKLSSDTNFAFQMGIDIFTVDLQQFRYFSSNQHSFGYNMIVYPQKLNPLQQSAPDRRITGYVWTEHYWSAPSLAQCSGCGVVGRAGSPCTYNTPTLNDFVSAMPNGNCASGAGVVYLFKGPSTTNADCTTTDPMIVKNVPGISPAGVSAAGCKTTFQNVTLRGTAVGSTATVSEANGFGFEGKITLTFQLANGENPHFVIEPKMYVKSMSVNGAFSGSSSTCRGSPYWPVPDSMDSSLPNYICEEPDARTFGPTDWAAIFFDIKDVDANLVTLKTLYIDIGTAKVRFYPSDPIPSVSTDYYVPQYKYFNFRNIKAISSTLLATPTTPSGVVPPKDTDFGFAFTPGAHNENMKITIYCTLSIQQSTTTSRRFKGMAGDALANDNTVQERIDINNRQSGGVNAISSGSVQDSSSNSANNNGSSSSSSSSGVTVIVLASACAVLLAAVVGLVLYVVRNNRGGNINKIHSSA